MKTQRIHRFYRRTFATVCLGLLVGLSDVKAQDVLFFSNGDAKKGARILDVSDDKVKLTVLQEDNTEKEYDFTRKNLLMFFSKKGNFLILSELDSDLSRARQQVRDFLKDSPRTDGKDYLIKAIPLTVIPGTISYESDELVNYQTDKGNPGSVNKNELLAILYRDGRHLLLRDPTEVGPILPEVRRLLTRKEPEPPVPDPTPQPPVAIELAKKPDENPTGSVQPDFTRPPTAEKVTASPAPERTKPPGPESKPKLSEEEYMAYRKKAINKVNDFVQYLNIITDKSYSAEDKDKAIEQASKLFMPTATIEVNSKNRDGVGRYPIKAYLSRLKMLQYGAVNIEWSEVQYLQELVQENDGNYYGTITGQQTFTGYRANGKDVMYSDVTRKNVRVKLQSYQKYLEGQRLVNWDVLLGNIGIATK